MEVHHHPHSEGKRLKHYLFEFFMLFLAVFCGFLAENFREHLVERRQEKEYMHSLMEDLQTDTATLNNEIILGYRVSEGIAHLVSFINNEPVKDSVEKLYELNIQSNRIVSAEFEDRTSSQLKNAGNMRLVRDQPVADSIRSYWSIIKKWMILVPICSRSGIMLPQYG